jgi:outer membrane scaffolding protein for murein synthesis (MipA/OmpV family)
MKKLLSIVACSAALLPQMGAAEIVNAEIGFNYGAFVGNDLSGSNKSELSGSMEYAFSPKFSVQGDMALRYLDDTSFDSHAFTLHGVYNLNQSTAVGLFVGRDWVNSNSVDFYGVEAAGNFGQISYDGALTHLDGGGDDATTLSLAGAYALNDQLDLGGNFGYFDVDGINLTKVGMTAGYDLTPGVKMTGEFGLMDFDGQTTESYIGVGIKATFGQKGGTTFDRRGYIDFLPGLVGF